MGEQDTRSQFEDVAHQSSPLAAGGSPVPAFAHATPVEYEIDLLLTAPEAKLVEKFRQDIRLCKTDTEKFDKCVEKRDELLEEKYQLASKGQYYCNQFSAAMKPHTRENGVRKLNQLLLRRFRIPGRRDIRAGVNPIEPVDLRNLASWRDEGPFVKEGDPDKVQLQFVDLTCEDLPPGFLFDHSGSWSGVRLGLWRDSACQVRVHAVPWGGGH
jgi:hypothetical protein